jgi:LPS O-antigen subunit length determinant protein (WzzB/FepE family)
VVARVIVAAAASAWIAVESWSAAAAVDAVDLVRVEEKIEMDEH